MSHPQLEQLHDPLRVAHVGLATRDRLHVRGRRCVLVSEDSGSRSRSRPSSAAGEPPRCARDVYLWGWCRDGHGSGGWA